MAYSLRPAAVAAAAATLLLLRTCVGAAGHDGAPVEQCAGHRPVGCSTKGLLTRAVAGAAACGCPSDTSGAETITLSHKVSCNTHECYLTHAPALVRLDTMVHAARLMSSSSWARVSARRPLAGLAAEKLKSISTRFSEPSNTGV
jgi:hypothetical protein